MKYYDTIFRNNLIDILGNYRKVLSQIELSSDKSYNNIFISESIKKIDEAIKIIKPAAFDFLTEKKIEKIQTSEYYKQMEKEIEDRLKDKIRQETEQQFREKLTEEIKAELEPKIREELKKEKEARKAKKKAQKNAEQLEQVQSAIFSKIQEVIAQQSTQMSTSFPEEKNNISLQQKQTDVEFGDDDFDIEPEPEILE